MYHKGESLPRCLKLRGRKNFALFSGARQFRGDLLRIAVIIPEEGDICEQKAAFVTSKKVSLKAVDRNLIKRRLRDIYRRCRTLLPDRIWLMIIALPSAKGASYGELQTEIIKLFEKITSKMSGNIFN